jgi:hypothetical protein
MRCRGQDCSRGCWDIEAAFATSHGTCSGAAGYTGVDRLHEARDAIARLTPGNPKEHG